jgi:pyridoxine 4-dehydrogenase
VSRNILNLNILCHVFSTAVLGTWAWGDKKQWDWNDELDGKAKEAFDMSISKGINTFDTAEVYGNGER